MTHRRKAREWWRQTLAHLLTLDLESDSSTLDNPTRGKAVNVPLRRIPDKRDQPHYSHVYDPENEVRVLQIFNAVAKTEKAVMFCVLNPPFAVGESSMRRLA